MSKDASEANALKLITPEFRGSFVTVLKPRAFDEGQDPKYSMVIVMDKKDDKKFLDQLQVNIQKACVEKWGEVPKKFKIAIKDGDQEEEKYNWQGKTVFTASNKSQPGIVMQTEQGLVPGTTEEEIYSGAVFRCSIRPYAYEFKKAKGVAISLDNVLKVRDDEKFTNKTKAEDDFADFVEGDWE